MNLVIEEIFFRQMHHHEFDVSEISFSAYLVSRFAPEPPFIAIPIFPSRSFRHSGVYINANAGIQSPAELAGKKIGCAEYQLTANVWIRGIMSDEYGVAPSSYTTFKGRARRDRTRGEGRVRPDLFHADLGRQCEGRRLFPDTYEAERDYFERTGIFPIMHVVAIRREVYEQYPWVAQSLFKGFVEAQRITYNDLHETAALKVMLPWLVQHLADTERTLGTDFWSYGYRQNIPVANKLLQYHHEQGLSKRLLNAREMFAKETLESYKIQGRRASMQEESAT